MKTTILTFIVILFTNLLYAQFFPLITPPFEETKQLAEQGNVEAQFNLGMMYYAREDTLKDYKQAFYWTEKSAEQGYAKAQFNLGIMYFNGAGTLTDKSKAAFWIKKANESSDKEAKQMAKKFWEENELWKY